MRNSFYESVGLWQLLLFILMVCWNPLSAAQSEQRLHASLQAAVPEEPYVDYLIDLYSDLN